MIGVLVSFFAIMIGSSPDLSQVEIISFPLDTKMGPFVDRPYPRLIMPILNSLFCSILQIYITIGVLPVPPVVILPMLITVHGSL